MCVCVIGGNCTSHLVNVCACSCAMDKTHFEVMMMMMMMCLRTFLDDTLDE